MMQTSTLNPSGRIVWLDFIRALSCFMVIVVHSTDCFWYMIGEGNYFWNNLISSGMRSCVPLFVMVSSYLLVPLPDDMKPGTFYKRRFMRIFIPFAIWSVLYAVLPYLWGEFDGERVRHELNILSTNFSYYSLHLWFMYMLFGVYLIMPVISPWLKTVSKQFERGFLVVWFLTTFYHYLKVARGDLFGECAWNEFTPFWYVSGYIGYVVLAHYIRTYVDWSLRKTLLVGIPLFAVGYAATLLIFDHFASTSDNWVDWERGWRFCTFNVVMMTTGAFLMLKKVRFRSVKVSWLVSDIGKMSFAIYLMHMLVLRAVDKVLGPMIDSIPGQIFSVAIVTFIICYGISKALSYLPGSKYLIG